MGAWKNFVFDRFEQLSADPDFEHLSDDERWEIAEHQSRESLAGRADRLRDLAKEGR